MPQLKKVVLAVGNPLIYADTYEQALAQLSGNARAAAQRRSRRPSRPRRPRRRSRQWKRRSPGEHPRSPAAVSGIFEPGQMGRGGQGIGSHRSRSRR